MSNFTKIVNRGTGAGGANTNVSGLTFEKETSNELRLEQKGFERLLSGDCKSTLCLIRHYKEHNKTVIYTTKKGFKLVAEFLFGVILYREPDEAYIIYDHQTDTYNIHIIEKKNQTCEGSVEEKLGVGRTRRREYEICFEAHPNIKIQYAFCVSDFLKKKLTSNTLKYVHLLRIFEEDGISLLFGSDKDYFEKLDALIGI